MSTLYIRLPSRAVADNADHWITLPCQYALVSAAETVEREGTSALGDLAGIIGGAQRVVLLMAGSDVTLLQVRTPPLSASRLRQALPNLVEEQLMSDPADCVLVAGASVGDLRTVAVVQRQWLQVLLQTMAGFGARNVAVLPSQLCLAAADNGAAAVVTEFGDEIDLTLQLAAHDGLGLPLQPDDPERAPLEVIETLCALVPAASITLYVPAQHVPLYLQAAQALLALAPRVTVMADDWRLWIGGARALTLNLVDGLGRAGGTTFEWRRWRWPLALGTLLLSINVVALNVEWWRLSREAAQLRVSMVQIYRSAYPKETVIVDPAAQMRQKIAAAQRDAGQAAPDDFGALAAGFAGAWTEATQSANATSTGIASVDYRDRSLLVKPKPEIEVPLARLRTALASRKLSLTQSAPGIWQIRSAP